MGSVESVAVSGDENYAYIASRNVGYEVVNIENQDSLSILFTVETGSCEVISLLLLVLLVLLLKLKHNLVYLNISWVWSQCSDSI